MGQVGMMPSSASSSGNLLISSPEGHKLAFCPVNQLRTKFIVDNLYFHGLS